MTKIFRWVLPFGLKHDATTFGKKTLGRATLTECHSVKFHSVECVKQCFRLLKKISIEMSAQVDIILLGLETMNSLI